MSLTATQALTQALVRLADARQRPRCSEPGDSHMWTSDSPQDRAQAAQLCTGCPIATECHAAALEEGEAWHVRGGVDFRPTKKGAKTK